jgi:hypothetical protein
MSEKITNYHIEYLDVTSQYWHAESAGFAGGDHLLTALTNGWDVSRCTLMVYEYSTKRSISVYLFRLERRGEVMNMPVIDTPFLHRFIKDNNIVVYSAQPMATV